MTFEEAIATIKNSPHNEDAYHAALEYVARNRDQLKSRLFFELPGGLSGNTDEKWNFVKENSKERCGCGNERTFLPSNPRTEFRGGGTNVILRKGQKTPLRVKGGDKASTDMLLEVIDGDDGRPFMSLLPDPYAPLVFTLDLFSTRGYYLSDLKKHLDSEPVFKSADKSPLAKIVDVDLDAPSITLLLDEQGETFDEATEPDSTHKH